MQRHPSGCDPQAFRGRHSLSIPRKNARRRTTYDPVLETLPGMQTALGELERSGPSLYRGTIERSNLNRLANDLAEILVRHVNRVRFQAKIAAQNSPNHGSLTQAEPTVPRKRARPLRYSEESDYQDNGFSSFLRRSHRAQVAHESRGSSSRSSHPQDSNRTRPLRRRRLIRPVCSDESDDDDVQEVHRMERPRRSKERRGNLNDDMAYEHMERAAREQEEQRRRQREREEVEKQNAMVIDDSSEEEDDDEEFVPKIVCPKLYVRERALESDFASLTPIITDADDDTDTEHYRRWNARRTRKTVHGDNKTVHPVQKQCLVFPLGRKTRLVRDVVVDTYLMRALAKQGQHHANYKRILQPLPNIPKEYLQPGGRRWEDFKITEGFRKASSESMFGRKIREEQQTSITPNRTPRYSENVASQINASVGQRENVHRPTKVARGSGDASVMKEASNPVKTYSVNPDVSSLQFLAREKAGRDNAPMRTLNGLNQAQHDAIPLVDQGDQRWISTRPDARTGKRAAVGPLGAKVPAGEPIRSMSMPTMRQDVGRHMNAIDREHFSSINKETDERQAQALDDPTVLGSNDYQQNLRMPHNHQVVLNSNQGRTSQMHAHHRQPMYYAGQEFRHFPSIPPVQQASVVVPIPHGQRYPLQAGSQPPPTKEEIHAYQVMLQRSLTTPQTNPRLLQVQAFQEWQRQVRIQSLQQQQMLQRRFQQHQELLIQRAAQNKSPQAQHNPQASQKIVDQQLTRHPAQHNFRASQRVVDQHLNRHPAQHNYQASQRVVDQQFTRQFENQASTVREDAYPKPLRVNEKSVNIESNTRSGIEGGAFNTSQPLHSTQAGMNGRPSTVLAGTRASSFGVEERRISQPSAPSISGSKSYSMKGQQLSQTSNALIMPDSDADFDLVARDSKSDWRDNAKKHRSGSPRNTRVVTNEVSATVPSTDIAPEVQLIKTQPPPLPTSSVRGVPGWQWERLDGLVTQTNGQSQRQYQEYYQAQYELQLRKVMEEVRRKSEGTGAEYE